MLLSLKPLSGRGLSLIVTLLLCEKAAPLLSLWLSLHYCRVYSGAMRITGTVMSTETHSELTRQREQATEKLKLLLPRLEAVVAEMKTLDPDSQAYQIAWSIHDTLTEKRLRLEIKFLPGNPPDVLQRLPLNI